ncbi:glycosyl-transferase for dystroglycan-domain-containing protein [Mycotypha africana]|uniref:glycosyl-transferase for dystroglycan-domain-containing protein n=1 Tax=Mycotypha africana TaxID=64632 RepID=UPI0023000CB0|nr:glycosyl-transferase for dystroglycan-domain-containing protein [Mycotypha africana]KAI8967627.1 glycosyl-transferase for dystroglycan-domain-containing protein [Mycotypha africana]
MGPSIVHPYYSRATHVNNPKDITITTLVTNDRFPLLSRLASRYKGPISAAIHINDNSQKEEILAELKEIISSNSHVRRYVDIHLIIDNYDRQLNMWRNTAKLYARTDYIMMLDIDFYLCTDFRNEILTNDTLLQLLDNGHSALVIPAFEYILQSDGFDYRTFPKSKDALLKEVLNEKKLDMFHRSWIKGHSATNYRKWYGADQVYKVDDYDFSYEPYVIYKRKGSPWCDERFIGYGANKAACLYEMYISGIDYYVLPDDFLIHQSHDYPETTRRKERSFNRKIYANFREEICLRYARQFMANGEWDTSLANNAKSACGRIKEFNHVIKNINQ